MKRYRDEFGPAVDMPLNAIAYELTDGGEKLPDTFEEFRCMVVAEARTFNDINNGMIAVGVTRLHRWWKNAGGD